MTEDTQDSTRVKQSWLRSQALVAFYIVTVSLIGVYTYDLVAGMIIFLVGFVCYKWGLES